MSSEKTATRSGDDAVGGILWMVLASFLFVCIPVAVRQVGTESPAPVAAFFRYLFGVVLLLPWLGALIRNPPPPLAMRLYAARGLVHGLGVILWFYAMAHIPLAEVTAIGYTNPIYVTIGAAFFFGERVHIRRIAAIAVGLVGAGIILRPGFQEVSPGQLASVASAPLFAISFLLAKKLTGLQDAFAIVGMLSVACTIVLLPPAIAVWETPTLVQLGWFAVAAFVATAGHYALTRAIHAAPLTVTQPISFLQLVFATIFGITLFGEGIDPFVVTGGGLIIAAATFISHREFVAARKAVTPPPALTKV